MLEIEAAKAVADLIKPITDPLAKRLVDGPSNPGSIVTAALEERLAQVIRDTDLGELSDRMQRRAKYMSIRKQLGFENAVALALELASRTQREKRRTVDEDWFAKWAEAVEDVSDELVQSLWAQAFARQADSDSRRISLRALESLRLMERQDAVNFMRASEVLHAMGYVFANSNDVLERIMRPDNLDALVDLRLVEFEEQLASVLSAPGGYSMYFSMPPEFAKEAFRIVRLSARGRELAQTLPADQEAHYDTPRAFDASDPLLIPKYLNLVARNFDRRYDVSLCIYDPTEQRPPPGGRKRTHQWDRTLNCWKRIGSPTRPVDAATLMVLERPGVGE